MKVSKGKGPVRKEKKEVLKPVVEDRKVGKRKAAIEADKSRRKLAKNAKLGKKDPNKPKRPASAFLFFCKEEFRTIYKQEHPNVKAVSAVGKAGGEKWKSMSHAEKAPYEAKAAKRKSEYEKLMKAYNNKEEDTDDEEEEVAERSKPIVKDDEEEESGEEDDEEEDDDDDED
ncbi:unnamed protein product [Prunus armeniaca]|uniref:HMG box domain-containing protein n=1 Tax=Prunus armeniaca TaxID=36596 RepID=A0A6J5WPY1_PRUAR|nr:unnamed protein product [Prunus armeniaca]